ncbi:MAG: flagellar hook-basal body complex protein FliE [Bryobacteraceae bacterium]|jgi:flagellar hook-basal body complex protein FliE
MSLPILPVSSIALPDTLAPAAVGASSGGAFQDVLNGAIQRVESLQTNASSAVQNFLSGEGGELHTAILASQRADLGFDMFMQVRNKVVGAYQEIMKMQV